MRKVAAGVGVVALMNASVFAGTVTFEGSGQQVFPGDPLQMTLVLTATGPMSSLSPAGFNGADVLIGSNDALTFGFDYSSAWTGAMVNLSPPGTGGLYPFDLLVGGSNPSAVVGNSLVLGTININTQLPEGE